MHDSVEIRQKGLEFTKGARNLLSILKTTDEKNAENSRSSQASQPQTLVTEDTYFDRVREIAENIQRSPSSIKKQP